MGLEKINELRKAQKLSLVQLSEKSGIPKSTLSKITAGITQNPNLETIQAIARALGVPVDYFDDESKSMGMIQGLLPIRKKRVPLLGDVAAGEPIWAQESHEDYVLADGDVSCDFALKVKGDSMEPLLYDGDVVFVRQQPDVLDGQIAVVLVDDSATLKLLYHIKGGIQLVSKNSAYAPMIYTGSNATGVQILGLAVQYTRGLI
jgi:repressor LexA